MEWDLSKVYTAKDADEVKVGSKVLCANTIAELKNYLKEDVELHYRELKKILEEDNAKRFQVQCPAFLNDFAFVYLISEPEEKKLKWTDLKIGDVIRRKGSNEVNMVTGIREETKTNEHILLSYWTSDKELEEWEKVEENRSVEE